MDAEKSQSQEMKLMQEEHKTMNQESCQGAECESCSLDQYDPLFRGNKARVA